MVSECTEAVQGVACSIRPGLESQLQRRSFQLCDLGPATSLS